MKFPTESVAFTYKLPLKLSLGVKGEGSVDHDVSLSREYCKAVGGELSELVLLKDQLDGMHCPVIICELVYN